MSGGLVADSGDLRDVGESSVAVVVVQRIAARCADEQIFVAVVVVVADRDPEVEIQRLRPTGRLWP